MITCKDCKYATQGKGDSFSMFYFCNRQEWIESHYDNFHCKDAVAKDETNT